MRYKPSNTGSDPLEAGDAIFRFCRHAFELRDWLTNSDVDEAAKVAVRELFGRPSDDPAKRVAAKSVALAARADIANASKHSKLDRPSYSAGGHADITYERRSSLGDLPAPALALLNRMPDQVSRRGEHQWMWLINAGGVEYEALMLAEDAMRDWERCLVGLGLVEPEIPEM